MSIPQEIYRAILFGILEGITEWLPISSTGHLILLERFVKLPVSENLRELFLVGIQLGAILAVMIRFRTKWIPVQGKPWRFTVKRDAISLWGRILVSTLPAGMVGLCLGDTLEKRFYNANTVIVMLILVGVLFLVAEKYQKHQKVSVTESENIPYKTAFIIGLFQVAAAVFPGTSRSGATILGACFMGVARETGAAYTFYLAMPVMCGASLLQFLQLENRILPLEWGAILAGGTTAFLISFFTIGFFMDYVKNHSFVGFAWYRILLGVGMFFLFLYPVKTDATGTQPSWEEDQSALEDDPYEDLNRRVAITFDDGPDQLYTPLLLDGLKARNVKATFFLLGKQMEKSPELVYRMEQEGHLLGIHGYGHVNLDSLPKEEALSQVQKTEDLIFEISGKKPNYIRPPYGSWECSKQGACKWIQVLWDVDPKDWNRDDPYGISQDVVETVQDMDIILMHDASLSSVKAALLVIDRLKAKGYTFVTVEELLME